MTARRGRKRSVILAILAVAFGIGALVGPAPAFAAPEIELKMSHAKSEFELGELGVFSAEVRNGGDASLKANSLKASISVSAGLKIVNTSAEPLQIGEGSSFNVWENCTTAIDKLSAICSMFPLPLLNGAPGKELCMNVPFPFGGHCRNKFVVEPDPDVAPGTVLTASIEVCGGGAPSCAIASEQVEVVSPSAFSMEFDGGALTEDGEPATQAGSHPFIVENDISLDKKISLAGTIYPEGAMKDVIVDLPPGFVGNTNDEIIGDCTSAQLTAGDKAQCPDDSQIGMVRIGLSGHTWDGAALNILFFPLYKLQAVPGQAATLGFNFLGVGTLIDVGIRTGTDYGLRTIVRNTPAIFAVDPITLTLWGVPADHGHDALRGACMNGSGLAVIGEGCPAESGMPERPFLSLPTRCPAEPDETKGAITIWEGGGEAKASFFAHDNSEPDPSPVVTDGCNVLKFEPTIEARPTTNVADTPTGLSMDLCRPQSEDPLGTATAHMRDTVLRFPEGMLLNPSAANGLGSCSPAQAGLTSAPNDVPVTFTPDPAECPESSKLAKAEVLTELVERPLPGAIYLATPYDNPFDSLVAVYLMLHDPQSGIVIKSPAELKIDPATGQMTSLFLENPQLPFDNLKVDFFSGPLAAFRTPSSCGTYTTETTITPWSAPESGPPDTPSDSFAIINPAVGQKACATSNAARPHQPTFEAGTDAPIAGADSPLVVNLRRGDGTQEFSSVKISPPPGLIGKLAGIPACPEAAIASAEAKSGKEEQASPSCPAASQVGTVFAATGAGSAPYNAPGTAYLTGPHKGAPLGMAIVTPAVAGPFDLGTIVTRVALHVDPVTAQIRALADPIPSALQGIQLDVRSVSIRLDRPGFTRNPTSCDPMDFTGELTSILGQTAPLLNRFQLGECGRLGFRPKLSLTLKGSTKRLGHPSLVAVLTNRPGDANIASVSVALPPNEQLDQKNIGTVCTRVQFAASACPAASVYGNATVSTPILDQPLSGPVYLRSSSNKLPDLVPDLRGPASQPIRLEAAGRTDTVRGGLRNSFEFVPDAPFSKLVLTLNGGKSGLLVNSKNACNLKALRATVKLTAHNGLYTEARPRIKSNCKPKGKRSSRRAKRGNS